MSEKEKKKEIFREKSLQRVSSPENLNQYIHSATPSMWLLLVSVVLILSGIIVWAVFGKVDSSSVIGCQVEDHVLTAYLSEADYEKITEDSYIEIYGEAYHLSTNAVSGPEFYSDKTDAFLSQTVGITTGQWYYVVEFSIDLPDGQYKGNAVFEEISPITFILN